MNIRAKLTLRFLSIVSLIFVLASVFIYGFMADYRKDSFYSRLLTKAESTAKLLIEVEEVDINLLKKIEKDNPTSLPNEKIIVYNKENEVLFSTDEENTLNPGKGILDSIRQKNEIRYTKGEYEIAGFSFRNRQDGLVVIAGATDIYGKSRMQYLKTTLLIVNVVSFLLFFITGWFFSGQALSPIQDVMNQVDKISLNKLNLRVNEGNGADEIARLAKTFNRMLERLELAFKIEKNFIANASHELRTPLTAITGQLEVNLMKERTAEEYKDVFQSVYDDIKNLNLVANRLLLLAQTTTEQKELHFTPVRIDEILWQAKADLKKLNPGYEVHISLKDEFADEAQLTVSGNEQLLKTALTNLADNGCKYSHKKEVMIQLFSRGEKEIVIEFHDRGIGISPEDLPRVFEPFYRGKNALSQRGHGIGLSLVKRIIAIHEGKVTAESSPEKGTVFTVTLATLKPENTIT